MNVLIRRTRQASLAVNPACITGVTADLLALVRLAINLCVRLAPGGLPVDLSKGMMRKGIPAVATCLCMAACAPTPPKPVSPAQGGSPQTDVRHSRTNDQAANEIVLQAMGLLDTGYRFGGTNPDAGLDCSGMVSLVVERATGRKLPHNAAQIAAITRPISKSDLRPADLVFFNTNGGQYSHMGIYLGDGRFIHAPSSRGRVRIDALEASYYARHFSGARTLSE